MDWWNVLKLGLYYAILPLYLLVKWIFSILYGVVISPLYRSVAFVFNVCFWPVRFLARFEALYVYLFAAVVVGISTALVLHRLSTFTIFALGLNPSIEPKGPTIQSYRAARRKRREAEEASASSSSLSSETHELAAQLGVDVRLDLSSEELSEFLKKKGIEGQSEMLKTTILEEDDTDYEI